MGHDITQVSPNSLRKELGVISQEFFLFSGTILENITLYNQQFSFSQAQAAAKLAGAHAFIQALPLGYSTTVGGIKLDAKQQQKLALARALIKNPRILIVDEISSSVDSLSEYQFQQKLARFSHASIDTALHINTTFIITTNLSSIKNADTILVLDQGVLADQGTHKELMKKSKIYPTLIQYQLDM